MDQAFRDELVRSDVETRQAKLRDYFADELARIMGTSKSDLDLEQPLNEVGMDSLLASELKNNLERRLAFNLPMAAFLEGPSITTLAAHAAKALGPEAGEVRQQEPAAAPPVGISVGAARPIRDCTDGRSALLHSSAGR